MSAVAKQAEKLGIEQFSTEEFCAALVAALVSQGQRRLPIDHPGVDRGLREIVGILEKTIAEAMARNDRSSAVAVLNVLADISPNPNTGIFDAFWSHLRALQPGHLGVPNPLYEYVDIRVSPAQAEFELASLAEGWRDLVVNAAERLRKHL